MGLIIADYDVRVQRYDHARVSNYGWIDVPGSKTRVVLLHVCHFTVAERCFDG